MIRPLACLLAMSIPALASTSVAPDAQAAAARVNELFGQAIREAQASPGHDDNVSLARRLLDAAQHDSRQAEMAGALCDAAYGLASPAPQGLDLAAEAMELLAQRVPDRAADAAQKLLAIRRRQYGAAPASERPAMGERFIDSLTGVAGALAAQGKYADAISYLRQAASVAATIRSARQKELQAEIERLTALDRVYRVAEGFEARLRKDPGDAAARRRLIELYLIELDSPARAEKLLTPESGEVLRTYIPLATKPVAELQNVPCLELGNWYHTLSASATTPIGKLAMLRRAQGYLEAYVQKADAGDLAAVKVNLTLDKIQKELEALSPEPPAGPWVDVLKLVDPAKHGVSGRWARKGATIGAKAEAEDRFLVPAAPNGDYELKVQFTRTEGDGAISLVLPVGETSAALLLGYKAGQASGLSYVNGKACDDNETRSEGTLSNRTSHTVTVRVTTQGADARLRGTLDGKKLLDWKGPRSALRCPRSWSLPVGTALGLGAEKDSVALFTSAQLRMFSGQVSQVTYAKPPENPWDRIRDAWRDRGQGGPGPGGPGNRPGGPGNRPGPGRR